ncbi:MAG: aspartate 1-decarboxylase [Thermoactinomyces sp.]
MLRWMCKGKIHRATVTESDLNYEGSITLDQELMKAANILPYEMVQITNLRNATLWRTYAIPSPVAGKVGLNGPPAHLFQPGDLIVILSMGIMDQTELTTLRPSVVMVDGKNQILSVQIKDGLKTECDRS